MENLETITYELEEMDLMKLPPSARHYNTARGDESRLLPPRPYSSFHVETVADSYERKLHTFLPTSGHGAGFRIAFQSWMHYKTEGKFRD